jgi:hypothetical protein
MNFERKAVMQNEKNLYEQGYENGASSCSDDWERALESELNSEGIDGLQEAVLQVRAKIRAAERLGWEIAKSEDDSILEHRPTTGEEVIDVWENYYLKSPLVGEERDKVIFRAHLARLIDEAIENEAIENGRKV